MSRFARKFNKYSTRQASTFETGASLDVQGIGRKLIPTVAHIDKSTNVDAQAEQVVMFIPDTATWLPAKLFP
jgi:hypothetical protein